MLKKNNSMQGSSLIEVMVALFVFAIGILGVLSMQAQSVKLNNNASLYTRANILANEMIENMRASPSAAQAYVAGLEYCAPTQGTDSDENCCGEVSSGWSAATEWHASIGDQLPSGSGRVVRVDDEGDENDPIRVSVVVCFSSGANETVDENGAEAVSNITGVVNLVTGV